jgi:hypothetical protein
MEQLSYGAFSADLHQGRLAGERVPLQVSIEVTRRCPLECLHCYNKRFLQSALKNWKRPPAYLLLNGSASLDPRNYLGFGNLDLVPNARSSKFQPDDCLG